MTWFGADRPDERSPAYEDQSCPTGSFAQATALPVQPGGEGSSEVARRLEGGAHQTASLPQTANGHWHYRGITLGSPHTVLLHSIIDNTLFNDVRDVDCRLVGRTHDTGAAQPDADDPGANYLAGLGGGERPADAALSLGLRSTRLGSVTISQDTASRIFVSISLPMMVSLGSARQNHPHG
jgi:hypothetical protein